MSKDFNYQGETYKYLGEKVWTLRDGTRVQTTDYVVESESGSKRYPYLICKVPENYERIDLSKLDKNCLDRFFSKDIVEFKEGELDRQ